MDKVYETEIFVEALRLIQKDSFPLYFDPNTGIISNILYFNREYAKTHDTGGLIPHTKDLGVIKLPTYEEIDHKNIMSNYVKDNIKDKDIRKSLFNALRNDDYYDKFMNLLEEYKLKFDFELSTFDDYAFIVDIWFNDNLVNK